MIPKKILIVDDEPDVAAYLETLFQDNGYNTIIAYDGVAGVKIAQAEKPDLITLDVTMPNQSGIKTYECYKSDPDLIHTPVIIITATGDAFPDFLEKFKGLPDPEGFMGKPIDPFKLIEMISKVLTAGTSLSA